MGTNFVYRFIFLRISTKNVTFLSISQRNRKFVQIYGLTTFWLQKSFFCIYLDPSSARNLWNFEWGTRILKNLGIIDHSTINFHNHKRNGKTMIYKIEFERRTAIPTLQNTFDFRTKWDLGWWWWWGGDRIKAERNRVYLKAAADD